MINASTNEISAAIPNLNHIISQNAIENQIVAFIEPDTIVELNKAKQRLKQFAVEIGDKINTPIREDILKHCDRVKQSRKEILTYDKIERMVKNRIQKYDLILCRMIKNRKIKRNWGNQDISILIWVVSKYSDHLNLRNIQRDLVFFFSFQTPTDWYQISQLIPGVNVDSCMFRWLSLKKNKLSDNSWSEKQSLILDRLVEYYQVQFRKYGEQDWGLISQQLYKINTLTSKVYRCPKQCREHWNCYLNPNLKKGPWQQEEDLVLLTEIKKKNGEKRWTQLVKYLNGRTQNALKNRYNLILDKQKNCHNITGNLTSEQEMMMVDSYLERNYIQKLVNNAHIAKQRSGKVLGQRRKSSRNCKNEQKQLWTGQKRVLRKRKERKITKEEDEELELNELDKRRIYSRSFYTHASPPKVQQNHIIQLNYQDHSPVIYSPFALRHSQQSLDSISPLSCIDDEMKKINEVDQSELFQNEKKKEGGDLPSDIKKIKIIEMAEDDNVFQKLKQLMVKKQKNGCSFVPCVISDNKITKISYQ